MNDTVDVGSMHMSMDIVGIYISVAVVLLFLTYILRVATDTRSETRLINGKLMALEEWKTGFTQLAQERHDSRQRELDRHERWMEKMEARADKGKE